MSRFPKNFPRAELLRSQTATRRGIDNTPTAQINANLLRLAFWLQTLRDRISATRGEPTPLIVTSGYRSPQLNAAIGGSTTSAHMKGLAADIVCPAYTPLQLAHEIEQSMGDLGWDQIIHEFGEWVHIGLAAGEQRWELLTAHGGGRYSAGLVAV